MNADRQDFFRRCAALHGLPRGKQHHAARRLLRMRHLNEMHAFDGLKKCREFADATPTTVLDLSAQFDPFRSLGCEPALVRNVSSSRERIRLACDFGPVRRMHQTAVARIIRYLHPPLGSQYLLNGGMPMALGAIEAAISAGATHSCELDFVDFYGSVRADDLAEVMRPLPRSVTEHVVWDTRMREGDLFTYSSASCPSPTPETPNGLYPGSAVSPVVGEVLIARLLEAAQLPGIITYADNLCVLGRSEKEVAARIDQLRRVIDDPPFVCVSGLRLRENEVRNVIEPDRPSVFGVEFANHQSVVGNSVEGTGRITGWKPTPTKLAQFQISAADYVTVGDLNRAISKVSNWRRYYSNWPDGDLLETEDLAALKARRFTLSPSPEHKSSAIAAVSVD